MHTWWMLRLVHFFHIYVELPEEKHQLLMLLNLKPKTILRSQDGSRLCNGVLMSLRMRKFRWPVVISGL